MRHQMLLAVGLLFAAQSVNAEAPIDFLFKDGKYAPFESKPAEQLMTAAEFAEYQSSLRAQECNGAARVLNRAFVRNYPQFTRVLKNDDSSNNHDYMAWESYMLPRFDDFYFCKLASQFPDLDKQVNETKAPPPKYVYRKVEDKSPNVSQKIRTRDSILRSLITLADKNYIPALVKMAEFVQRRDLFDAGADVEFYLLTRVCHLGGDCAPINARLEELAASLSPERREDIATKARAPEAFVKEIFNRGEKL